MAKRAEAADASAVAATGAGETEFQSLTPAELRMCRNIVAINGQRVSELESR